MKDEEASQIRLAPAGPGVPYDPGAIAPVRSEDPNSPPRSFARVSLVGQVHHQRPHEQPTTTQLTFSRTLAGSERPIVKDLMLTPDEWTHAFAPTDRPRIGLAVVHNPLPRRSSYPTEEQRAEDRARIVEVAFWGPAELSPVMFILPGESLPVSPLVPFSLRTQRGSVAAVLTLYPA